MNAVRLGTRIMTVAAAALWLAGGCGNDPSQPTPNQPPITQITGGPADSSIAASHVSFYVLGTDYDGTVQSQFDYILDTYPRSVATIDQVTRQTPATNDPRWHRVATNQIDIVALADTLRADPTGPIGEGLFDRWHTFYVRAVDNEGAIDATPESRTFHAITQAPVVRLLAPVQLASTATLGRTFIMNWDGYDAIGHGDPFQQPLEARWVLLPASLDGSGHPIGFPAALYALPDTAWSDWAAWTAADSSGREKAFQNLVPSGAAPRAYVFAIQGRDDAGAVTPQFDASTTLANNYATISVSGTLPVGPIITIHALEDTLASWVFNGTTAPQINISTAEAALTLYWDAPRASHYGARTNGCRFGWNIADVNDDNQWSPWSTARFIAPHVIGASGEIFRLQCRDQLGQITTAVLVIQPL